MKKLSRIKALLAMLLCVCTLLSVGTVTAFADDASNSSQTYSFNDLPYHTGYSNFGYFNAGHVDYTLKVGQFDASKENFNLKAFDTWDGENKLTLSTVAGACAENWQWKFAENSSIVLEIKSKITGTIQFDFTGAKLGGWMDAWPSVFGLYRYNAATASVETLARNFQADGSKPLDPTTYNHTVEVKKGDRVFFEIGKCNSNDYSIQDLNTAKIIATPTAAPEEPAVTSIDQTYSFNDLPYHTGYSEFGYYDAGFVDYVLKVGLFDASKENFNLKAFDTWDGKNMLTLSTVAGACAENWRWQFTENSSVVLEIKSKINGAVKFDFTGVTLGGWMDAWPSIFGLYRYNAATATVDTLARNYQNDGAKPLDPATYTHTVEVREGDIVFFEIGKCNSNGYNIQDIQHGKIIATATTVNATVIAPYSKRLDDKVGALVEANYIESDWAKITQIVADFKASGHETIGAMMSAFEKAVSDIEAITPDPFKTKKNNLIAALTAHVEGLVEENYAPSDWSAIISIRDAFLSGIEACETEDALQAVYDGKLAEINAITPDPLKDMRTNLINSVNAHVEGLDQNAYKPADWEAIVSAKDAFISGCEACETKEQLQALYEEKMALINAISPDLLKDDRNQLIATLNDIVGGMIEENYTANDWATVIAARDAFVSGAEACETEEALRSFYEEKLAAIKAVKAYKQGFTYLDYPSKMNENGYAWIEGELFSTKLYAGTVENLKEFDTKGATQHVMYNSEFNEGFESPSFFVENWKWYISYNMGVITAYRANVDLKLVITNNRLASGYSTNGWTEDCALTYYIVRGDNVKAIKTVNAPSLDADFGGAYYLKAGDILYIEFNSTVINAGEIRNAEAPCNMKVEADSTAFDQDAYAEQNHDLAPAVIEAIESKKAELEAYYAGLNQADYSATNWLTIGQYIEQFQTKCESEVETVADVEALFNSIKAEMQAVPTLAQAEEELKAALNAYAQELQAEYDALVSANSYNKEGKAALDKALADGKAKILAAKSKTVGNQEKIKAIAALKAVEPGKDLKGCKSSMFTSAFASIFAAVACVLFIRKRK